MTEKELRNLQVYISKRSKGQTDEQVLVHINDIDIKTSLAQEEWKKLIFPCCINGYVAILKFVLTKIDSLNDVLEYMKHTVYGRNENINSERIDVLKIFMSYLTDKKAEALSETMIYAAWFGETEIVKFLVENGADKSYCGTNGLGLRECAIRAEKQFNDGSLLKCLEDL